MVLFGPFCHSKIKLHLGSDQMVQEGSTQWPDTSLRHSAPTPTVAIQMPGEQSRHTHLQKVLKKEASFWIGLFYPSFWVALGCLLDVPFGQTHWETGATPRLGRMAHLIRTLVHSRLPSSYSCVTIAFYIYITKLYLWEWNWGGKSDVRNCFGSPLQRKVECKSVKT